jgi:hypothetical protein
MKDLGEAHVILNTKLIKDMNGITLSQSHYVEKVLNRFTYMENKLPPSPYDPSVILRKNKKTAKQQLRYSLVISSLMYLASAMRPTIYFAENKLSRFISDSDYDHWHTIERVMRYLVCTEFWDSLFWAPYCPRGILCFEQMITMIYMPQVGMCLPL